MLMVYVCSNHIECILILDLLALAFGGYKSPLGMLIKKADSLDELPQSTLAVLGYPINPNSTYNIPGISIQIPPTTFEQHTKTSPNIRALRPVKFAKSQEVELLWLETVKVRCSYIIRRKRILSFCLLNFIIEEAFSLFHLQVLVRMTRTSISLCYNQSLYNSYTSNRFYDLLITV